MVKLLFEWPKNEIWKISNFGSGRSLGPNDYLFRPWLKERRYCFSKNFIRGHDLRINRMLEWFFWRAWSENLKNQNFGCGRSMGQNDRCFTSYITGKNLIILYEHQLWLCFMKEENGKMIALIVKSCNFIKLKFWVWHIAVLNPSLFYVT